MTKPEYSRVSPKRVGDGVSPMCVTVFVSLPSRRVNLMKALAGAAPLQAEHIIVCRWYSGIVV
jgi:hypothetical protein